MRISDWSSDVCSSDLLLAELAGGLDDGFDAFGPALPRLQRQVERGQQVVQAGRSEIAGEEPASAAATGEAMPLQRSEEHTSELQSLMRISYAVFCLKKKKTHSNKIHKEKKITIKEIQYTTTGNSTYDTSNYTR